MATLIISRLTIREAQRRRILWVALFMGAAFLLVFGIGFYFITREFMRFPSDGDTHRFAYNMLLTAGLYAVNLLVTVVAVLVSVTTISGEIETHTIDIIVTKPLPRWQVVIGKWLAYAFLVLAYLVALAIGLMLIVYLRTGYTFENLIPGLLMMALGALTVLTVSIAGGSRLSTLANGVLAFMLFGIAFLGGLLEQIGAIFRNDAVVNIGILTSLLMPADALWKKALAYFQPRDFSLDVAGPFGSITEPSTLMVAYGLLYIVALLLFALWSLSRRDL